MLPWSSATNPATTEMKIALGYRNADGSLQMDANRTVVAKLSLEIFVSRNGGRSSGAGWVSKGNQGLTSQLWWDNMLAVGPFNPHVFLSGEQELYRSTNIGDDWVTIPMPHEDQQSVQFDRNTQGLVYIANDGGVFRSTGGGQSWMVSPASIADEIAARRSLVKNPATAEFYRVGVQNQMAVGNLFHSGLIGATRVGSAQWEGTEGHAWEWAYVFVDPKRVGRFYVFHGQLARRRYPGTGADIGVFVSDDEGDTWQPYGDDLPNAEVQQIFWTGDYLYAITYGRGLWRIRPR